MKKVVAYGSYNNEKNISYFEKQIQEELKNHEEWEVVKNFIDYTKSKSYISFEKLLNQILNGDIDIILIKDIPQFCKVTDYAVDSFMNLLNEKKIELIFLDEKTTTLEEIGQIGIKFYNFIMISEEKAIRRMKKDKSNCYENIVSKNDFKRVQKELKHKKTNDRIKNNRKIYGYDYIDGKYQVNEKEAIDIKTKVTKAITDLEKEEKRKKANKSRSEKMKKCWQNEKYRNDITEKIKIGKRLSER